MPISWMIVIIALWVAMIILAVIVLGVLRQVTTALDRAAVTRPGRGGPDGPPIGEPLPHFQARDATGELVDDERLRGSAALLLFLSAGCGPCEQLAAELNGPGLTTGLADQLYVITDTEGVAELGLPPGLRLLTESAGRVSAALAIRAWPFAVAVDADGVVRATRVPNALGHIDRMAAVLA